MKIVSGIAAFTSLTLLTAWAISSDPATPVTTRSLIAAFSKTVSERSGAVEQNIAYGPLDRQRLDVYHPTHDNPNKSVVMFIYGGSWRDGQRDMYGFVGAALAARGFNAVIVDYRLFPETRFPGFVEDAALAYRWVARRFAGNCGRPIVVMGHSAGAHIGALLAYDRSYLDRLDPGLGHPVGFIGLAGPYAFDPTTWPTTREIFAQIASPDIARPVAHAAVGGPPALLIHGLDDQTVNPIASETMEAALRAAHTPVELYAAEGLGHVGVVQAIAWPFRWRAPVLDRVTDFLAHLRQQKSEVACS
jgi:acetyl esterase/lipase